MANIPTTVLVCVGRCRWLPPPTPLPPPPPPPPSPNQSFSPYLIFMFCGLSVSFVFICYLLFAARRRRRQGSLENNNSDLESHDDFMMDEDHGPALHHPIWLINTVGLEKSQIESIQVFKYKKDEGLIEGTDCSVCLSEFEDDENLRLLPKCSHAFHVPCIDMWLSSHKNCPLCRAPIINPTTPQTVTTTNIVSNPIEPSRTEGEDSDTIDHHVIEIENNEDVEKTCATSTGARANSDLVDRNRVQVNGLVPMRRSVSMHESSVIIPNQGRTLMSQLVMPKKPNSTTKSGHKLKRPSSSSFRVCSKAMKSSSFGHSSRKASSSTIKCPYNRSY